MKDGIKASTTSNSFDFTGAAIRHVIHPLWARVNHPTFASYMREFERNQYLHPDDLRKLQMRRLRQQLIDAYRYVPFYRHRMTQAGLTPLDIRTHEDLRLLPVLTKRDIQDHQDLLVSSNVPPSKRQQNQTGGSTGSPLQFFVDSERFDSRMASTLPGTIPGPDYELATGTLTPGVRGSMSATLPTRARPGGKNFSTEIYRFTRLRSAKKR